MMGLPRSQEANDHQYIYTQYMGTTVTRMMKCGSETSPCMFLFDLYAFWLDHGNKDVAVYHHEVHHELPADKNAEWEIVAKIKVQRNDMDWKTGMRRPTRHQMPAKLEQ